MVILGIDPGVATIGFGLIRAERGKNTLQQYGVITTPAGIPLSQRLLQISRWNRRRKTFSLRMLAIAQRD